MIRIDTSSPAFHRLTAAGFKFLEITRRLERQWRSEYKCDYFEIIEFSVQCICGKIENGAIRLAPTNKSIMLDIARIAENAGALSVLHLKNDGYSIEEIRRIRSPYA